MGNVSYSAHISNGKSAITSKSKLLGVAKHNLRKYKSPEYSSDNILLLRGTEGLYQDVKNVYHQEFDEVVQQYNQKQKRADRRIGDYFEHVANLNQDMAVEIIFQCGDKEFWEEHTDKKEKMYNVYAYLLSTMERLLPNFKVANAVMHFDEVSPHMHVVGVSVWEGAKKGLPKKLNAWKNCKGKLWIQIMNYLHQNLLTVRCSVRMKTSLEKSNKRFLKSKVKI